MNKPSQSMRELAHYVLALEAAAETESGLHGQEALRLCDKLRTSLTRFAGLDGFTALLRRALALARADVPALQRVKVTADGCLEGLEDLAGDAANAGPEAAIAISAYLFELLVTFIGEPLTLRMVREAWPELKPSDKL